MYIALPFRYVNLLTEQRENRAEGTERIGKRTKAKKCAYDENDDIRANVRKA